MKRFMESWNLNKLYKIFFSSICLRSNKHSAAVIYSHYSSVRNSYICAIKVFQKVSLLFICIIINHWSTSF